MSPGTTTIGLIGPGIMGRPIAGHLRRAGWRVVVHARSERSKAGLAGLDVEAVGTPAEVAAAAAAILLVLPDAAAVESVVADIAASGRLQPGSLVIDLSTISPDAARAIGATVGGAGGRFVDAPMSGGEAGAVEGSLSIMLGGTAEDVADARAILAPCASTMTHAGPVGAGQTAKAITQLVVLGTLEVVAEALSLAASAGLDGQQVRTALLGGLAGSRILELAGRRMLEADFAPGGRLRFHAKDVISIRQLAGAAGMALPAFEAAAATVARAMAAGDGDLDHAVLARHLERAPGSAPETPRITFADADRIREYQLPGRDWALMLGPQNSPSRRMTLSVATFPAGSAPGLHVHPSEDEVVYVVSGNGRLEADGGGGLLAPGSAFHVPFGLAHGAVNNGSEPLVLVCVFSPPVVPASYDAPTPPAAPADSTVT